LREWLTVRPRGRSHLTGFLTWARDRGLMSELEMRNRASGDPKWFVADHQRWDLARRVTTDDTVPAVDRVAALLVLLYGQPAARIVRLTRADVHVSDRRVFLRLGPDHLVLPPPLD
jgi:hypothetical protein